MTFSAFVRAVPKKTGAFLVRMAGRAHGGLVFLWCLPVFLYRKFLSPLKSAGTCRFTPTCSRYFLEAVREWGVVAGTLMAAWRVLRCNPFSQGGYDPVPKRSAVFGGIKARLGGKPKGRAERTGAPESRNGQSPEGGDPTPHP